MHILSAGSFFPVVYSLLSPHALIAEVTTAYGIEAPTAMHLYVGVNDTYTFTTPSTTYILRVYRTNWRSLPQIRYELDVLAHLHRNGVPVATPIARHDGTFVQTLNAPEGPRAAVLFTYAPGREVAETEGDCSRFGRALGQLHTAMTDFVSVHARFTIDLAYLLDRPLHLLEPVLVHRRSDWTYLVHLADELRRRMAQLPVSDLASGICHGDFQRKNARITDGGTITVFDFDQCGPGWLAYDLAVFRPTQQEPATEQAWRAFLTGYQVERTLSAVDVAAIPLFVAMIRIQSMGFFAEHRYTTLWGADMMNDAFFDHEVAWLRTWMETEV